MGTILGTVPKVGFQPQPEDGYEAHWASTTHEGAGHPVCAIILRTLMRDMQLSSIDLLKIDIEGAEKEVFEVCDWMGDVHSLMIELHDRFKPGCSEAVAPAVEGFSRQARGFTTLFVREAGAPTQLRH